MQDSGVGLNDSVSEHDLNERETLMGPMCMAWVGAIRAAILAALMETQRGGIC